MVQPMKPRSSVSRPCSLETYPGELGVDNPLTADCRSQSMENDLQKAGKSGAQSKYNDALQLL